MQTPLANPVRLVSHNASLSLLEHLRAPISQRPLCFFISFSISLFFFFFPLSSFSFLFIFFFLLSCFLPALPLASPSTLSFNFHSLTMGVRIRPASAPCVIILIAFGLQLVAVLSAPITRAIALSTYNDITYGVFGYCTTDKCSSVSIGYPSSVTDSEDRFSLSSSSRHILAYLLIANVVAAGLQLILLVFTLFAHLHKASHSSIYLTFVFIFAVFTFAISLLAFLADILMFVPHMAWGVWVVLVSTVLTALYIPVFCIMRRSMGKKQTLKTHESSELHNLNQPIAYIPDNGLAYGSEKMHDPVSNNSNLFHEVKYSPVVRHESAATDKDDGSSYIDGRAEVSYNSEPTQPFLPVTSESPARYQNQNRYDNYQPAQPQQQQHSNMAYPQYRDNTPVSNRGTTPSDYSRSNYSNNYDYGHNPNAPSEVTTGAPSQQGYAIAAARAAAPVPSRRNREQQSIPGGIVPAGTYDSVYQDSPNMDSYSDFGASVVSVPKIHNPAAIRQTGQAPPFESEYLAQGQQQQQHPLPFPPAAQRAQPRNEYYAQGASSLPVTYETTSEPEPSQSTSMLPKKDDGYYNDTVGGAADDSTYNPPRPRWRQYAAPPGQNDVVASSAGSAGPPQQTRNITPPEQNQAHLAKPSPQGRGLDGHHSSVTALRNAYLSDSDGDGDADAYSYKPPSYKTNASVRPMRQGGDGSDLPALDNSHLQVHTPYHSSGSLNTAGGPSPTSPAISASSHFTSVSQREPNPRYYQAQPPAQALPQPPAPPPQGRPARQRNDLLLDNNPDFQILGPASSRKYGAGASTQGLKNAGTTGAPGTKKNRSSLKPGFGVLDGPYGASRGL